PFKGIRPVKDKAKSVASPPYDVLNSQEARIEVDGNPDSFLHVLKPEIDLPEGTDVYSQEVYNKARENFNTMLNDGVLMQDDTDCLYVYAQKMNGQTQYGLVGCASVEDYFNDVIKKHELTRPDKEKDRMTHVDVTNINAGPVFMTYPDVPEVDEVIDEVIKNDPEYDFTAVDGIQHTLWVVSDSEHINILVELFNGIPATYIADGHHRTASAALVGKSRKENNPDHNGDEEYNYFLAVHFPASQLNIIDYNRVVKDLNGLSSEEFVQKLSENFEFNKVGSEQFKPAHLHEFGMYLDGSWYSLKANEGTYDDNDPIGVLDVTILSNQILDPILGIKDLRTDKRIDFVGGIRGLGELEKRVDSGEMKVAFALFPVSIEQLINISDTNNIMPPKTTWFEPKLRSGLIVHSLN
ncbi:MAG: DUF1015 domain-containing protein, partial [Bacteroidia bacterium]|nr:DUF1015 domain-containing protein [Bacteroidia bacterium]